MNVQKNILFLFALMFCVSAVSACSCFPSGTPSEELGNSDAVFIGVAQTISSGNGLVEVDFLVAEKFKGTFAGNSVKVFTTSDSASCGFPFSEQSAYLIYASDSEDGLSVSLCGRTSQLESAADDLEILREPEVKVCTADAKICPDGSAVGRNPDNNCQFDECPVVIEQPEKSRPVWLSMILFVVAVVLIYFSYKVAKWLLLALAIAALIAAFYFLF